MATGRADFWYGRPFVVTDVPNDGNSEDAPTANWAYNHAANPSAHHVRYSDAEAVLAMGPIANNNPLNHNRYSDGEAYEVVESYLKQGHVSAINPTLTYNAYMEHHPSAGTAGYAQVAFGAETWPAGDIPGYFVGGAFGVKSSSTNPDTGVWGLNTMTHMSAGYVGAAVGLEIDITNDSGIDHSADTAGLGIIGAGADHLGLAIGIGTIGAGKWMWGLALANARNGIIVNMEAGAGTNVGLAIYGGSNPANGYIDIVPADDASPYTYVIGVWAADGVTPMFTIQKAGHVGIAGNFLLANDKTLFLFGTASAHAAIFNSAANQLTLRGGTAGTRVVSQGTVDLFTILDSGVATFTGTLSAAAGGNVPVRVAVPAHNNSAGVAGAVADDANYHYRCIATDTWVRVSWTPGAW